ncbi:alpha-ketoglutarate-dependent dioxygenase FTO-like [Asterias amurensis]|uniref:alpha-ketoglutarate-dependent dioxygenase FTO-like n=1 Tax=Asterias amurensis TaxID=7602 RepID=UPI003AB35CA7
MSKMPKRKASGDSGKEIKKRQLLSEVAKGKLPFLTPADATFESLMKEKYSNFAHEPQSCIPESLQEDLTWALNVLYYHGYFYRDWVKVKGQTVQTPISRTLVGEPGTTYKYLGLRLFTIPWSFGDVQPENEIEIACGVIGKLNEHFKVASRKLLLEKENERLERAVTRTKSDEGTPSCLDKEESRGCESGDGRILSIDDGTDFNVALINYMDPTDLDVRLKPEPYYGMGSLAVSWHMDGNLVRGSTVAVYSQTYSDESDDSVDKTDWKVGLKVSWDIETPGVAIPLASGESYFMLGNLNDTHQHCVITGSQSRFSSTHRVADSRKGTLRYIKGRCQEALSNLLEETSGDCCLRSLDISHLRLTETIHNEVEFEWLRQFWMQGTRHATERRSWLPAIEALEEEWVKMEHMTKLAIDETNRDTKESIAIARILRPFLKERQKLRKQCLEKFSPRLLDTIHPDHLPVHRPKWEDGDPLRPLPFDLSDVINKIGVVCKSNRPHESSDSDASIDSKD